MTTRAVTLFERISPLQKFEAIDVARTQIANAPYNPRNITPAARAKLQRSLEEFGLVEPLIWNKRTGNLVGGHQRLSIIDDLSGTVDFALTVSAIDVDEDREKLLNAMLNNAQAQGYYDVEKLEEIFADLGKKVDLDLAQLFGELPGHKKKRERRKKAADSGAAGSFEVVIECRDAEHQAFVFEMIQAQGEKCRLSPVPDPEADTAAQAG